MNGCTYPTPAHHAKIRQVGVRSQLPQCDIPKPNRCLKVTHLPTNGKLETSVTQPTPVSCQRRTPRHGYLCVSDYSDTSPQLLAIAVHSKQATTNTSTLPCSAPQPRTTCLPRALESPRTSLFHAALTAYDRSAFEDSAPRLIGENRLWSDLNGLPRSTELILWSVDDPVEF